MIVGVVIFVVVVAVVVVLIVVYVESYCVLEIRSFVHTCCDIFIFYIIYITSPMS